jgi:CheY-like chemotaxis protein
LARKILLADDSVTAQNMGRKILADAGYEVTTVNNGSAALKRIAEQRPDLIVLDVYMPGYSGLEVCQRLKESGDTSRVPVLLTVGKLEPFKPEEAKRVRADGFIVKPFEASELLSALSKLEDKIVPRAETSKPGRLARAAAALDEAPRDKTVSGEEDSGWKNRIAFPSKKKEKAEAEADDSAIYNPVNKDLRTVIEQRPAAEAKSYEPKAQEQKVDLGALAPEGLPKDVTQEEIAALASAAAQIQGKPLASKGEEAAESKNEEVKGEAATETKTRNAEISAQMPAAEPVTATVGVSPMVERIQEEQPQERIETPPARDIAPNAAQEAAPVSAPAEAVAEFKQEGEKAKADPDTASRDAEPSDVPVTMAMAVAAGADTGKSHWTAVAVAVAPEESGISLEEEMRKASAVYATPVEATTAEAIAPVAELAEAIAPDTEPVVTEMPAPITAESTQTLSEIAAVATDTVRAAVKEFETVSAAYVPENESAQGYSSPVASSPVEAPASEPAPVVEQEAEPTPNATEEANKIEAEVQQPSPENFKPEETESRITESAAPLPEVEAPVVQEAVEAAAQASSSDAPHHASGKTEHEGDNLSASTAAAWANWRRTRESKAPGDSPDSAAMAVAAGAEKSPEEAFADATSDPAIASIVDSVLADLRPKIVEEISRKLGKMK